MNDFEPFKPPAPGRFIARCFVTLWAVLKIAKPNDGAWDRLRALAQRHYLTPIILLALVLSPVWAWIVFEVILKTFEQLLADIPADADEKRAHFYALGLTFTGLGALLAPPFILIKAWVNERQTTATEQGLITDRFTRAVEQLGAMRDVKDRETGNEHSEPNIEVRLGALYALERIAQDSERDHIPIMETLCAYIRENAPGKDLPNLMDSEWEPMPDEMTKEEREAREKARYERFGKYSMESQAFQKAQSLEPPRPDIQTALTIIGRRSIRRQVYETEQNPAYRLDLRTANLQRADLNGLARNTALLTGARLEGADLGESRLEWADLGEARLEGANLSAARLEGANLSNARLEGANLSGARLKSADLARCIFARMRARSADFTDANDMTQDQVNALFGDTETKIPPYLSRTTLLNNEPLEKPWAGDPAYQEWLANGAPPGVPLNAPPQK